MRWPWARTMAALVGAGVLVRLCFAFATEGVPFDIESLRLVGERWRDHPTDLYELGNRWPYPPLFVPLAWALLVASEQTGLAFHGLIQLPSIAADAGIAVLVAYAARWAGASERSSLAACALVALGPSFILISGYHGQIDAVAFLPAVAAVVLWERSHGRRALYAGLLIGVGAAIKTVPIFVVLALLPSVRDRREALVLIASAAAVPLLALAPWLLSDPTQTVQTLRANRGVPGLGGLSTLVQPELTRYWIQLSDPPRPSPAIIKLADAQSTMVLAGVAAAALVAWRARARAPVAATLIFAGVWAANPNWAFQYLIWGLPFLVLAGHLRAAALLQAAATVPAVVLYARPATDVTAWPAVAVLGALYVAIVAAMVLYARRLLAERALQARSRVSTP